MRQFVLVLCAWVLWSLDQYPSPFRSDWFENHYNPLGATQTDRACEEWRKRIEGTDKTKRVYLCLPDTSDPRPRR
jgi:hypothetical protein